MKELFKYGNMKINTNTGVFCLPTSVCKQSCTGCYAKSSEKRFPNVLKSRNYNLEQTGTSNFVVKATDEIKKKSNKIKYLRIHESGDFYSQEYIDKWIEIITHRSEITFYAYTKRIEDFNFNDLKSLSNMNLINSMTPFGVNYGNKEYCDNLVKNHGYKQCPCAPGVKLSCQKDCSHCSTKGNDKIVFLKH